MGSLRWLCVMLLSFCVCIETGCGGGGGSQGGSSPADNPTPTLTGLSPVSGGAGSAAFILTATGSGFVSGSAIDWNGTALATTYVSSTSLTAQVPASNVSAAGTASVTVQTPTPGGGTSGALSFTINPPSNPSPTVTALSPSSAKAGGPAFALTVTGTQFISSSQVLWNGTALATTYVSSTSLTAQVPASDVNAAGTASVTVLTPAPGGGTSGALSFTINPPPNPSPTVTALSPSSAKAGATAFALTVTGTQFISSSQVLWNGAALATTYVSSTSLTAQVPASDVSAAGTASVTVQTPTPGGGTSGSVTFTINPPATNLTVLDLEGSDIAWSPIQQKLYIAVPAAATTNGNTITVVDPVAGSIAGSQVLNSAASGLAVSDDGQYLYAVVSAASAIQRLKLPSLTTDIQWSLGGGTYFSGPFLAGDVQVKPGAPHTVAVAMGQYGSGSVAVFDDGVERPAISSGLSGSIGNSVQWKADGSAVYAAYTESHVSGYFTAVSDDALFVMPVTQAGVGAATTYDSSFRGEGSHIHLDPATGYVYSDWGEVVNIADGERVGNFRFDRPSATYFPGPLSVFDSTLKRFYTLLEVTEPNNTVAFQIQAFDQTNYQLLTTLVIPAAVGTPQNLVRWGHSGLAFVTGPSNGVDGRLYILDGDFVNPSGVVDSAAGSAETPVPTLTDVSPLTATAGSQSLILTVTGRDFDGQSTLYWNGSALQTTHVSSTELSAQIPASDLTAVSHAVITATNSGAAFPASNGLPFAVNTAPPAGNQLAVYGTGGDDLVWDATAAKLYVSMPGSQGDAGDAIEIVDPVAGTVTSSGFLGCDPDKLALSSDGHFLYAGVDGENAIDQLTLPGFAKNASWTLGGAGTFDGPRYALDVQAAPGSPQTTAVVLANFDVSPSPGAVAIYDNATLRGTELSVLQWPYSSLQWAGNASTLYAVDQQTPQDLLVLGVGASGAVLNQHYSGLFGAYSNTIHYDAGTGLVYTDAGQAVQPSNGSVAGSYGASGIVAPDSTLGRIFILGQTASQVGTTSFTIDSFNQTTFALIGAITIDNVVGTPTAFIRWGTNGLAFTTMSGIPHFFTGAGPGQLYVVRGSFVNPTISAAQPARATPLQPVQRTWDVEPHANQRPAPMVQSIGIR